MTPQPFTRTPGWRGRLNAYLGTLAGRTFEHGRLDCGLFVGGAIAEMTGTDPVSWLRGRYRDLAGLQQLLAERGFTDHIAYVDSLWPQIGTTDVRIGDVVAVEGAHDLALGLVTGAEILVMEPRGLAVLPVLGRDPDSGAVVSPIKRAWRASL